MLLTSSLTMALAVWAVQTTAGSAHLSCRDLALGAAFLVFKGFEYYSDYRDGLMPFVPGNFKPEEWRRGDGHGQGEGADAEKGDATPVEAQDEIPNFDPGKYRMPIETRSGVRRSGEAVLRLLLHHDGAARP